MAYTCIALGSGIAAGKKGCGKGPQYIKDNSTIDELVWESVITPYTTDIKDKCTHVSLLNQQHAKNAYRAARENELFFSIGGDHSSAIGTWSGVAEAYRDQGDIGLLWIDAHMDCHTLETSPSGNIHGMPLAALLGYGDSRLTHILSKTPKLKAENIALIGIRDYEDEEKELLDKLRVRVYYIDEVDERGLKVVLQEARDTILSQTVGYGVSFDLDAIDPIDAKAVGTPVPNGIRSAEALEAMAILQESPPIAFEFVEYNPLLDDDKQSFYFIQELFQALTTTAVTI